LSRTEALGLWLNMPRLRARMRREALEMAGRRMTVDEVRALALAETEDPEQADQAAADYYAAILRADTDQQSEAMP